VVPLAALNTSSSLFETAFVESPFGMLPLEVSIDIFRHLNVRDLLNCFLVCRLWNLESMNEQLWKTVVVRNFPDIALLRPSIMTWRMLALALAGLWESFVVPFLFFFFFFFFFLVVFLQVLLSSFICKTESFNALRLTRARAKTARLLRRSKPEIFLVLVVSKFPDAVQTILLGLSIATMSERFATGCPTDSESRECWIRTEVTMEMCTWEQWWQERRKDSEREKETEERKG
jgi:hypothetical protein